MSEPFVGYSGRVWSTAYAGILYYGRALAVSSSQAAKAALSQAMLQTLLNATSAINAATTLAAWRVQYSQLATILTLPLALDTATQTILLARYNAYAAAITALSALIPQPASFAKASTLATQVPLIPDMGYLDFCAGFAYAVPPAGLTPSNFYANAQAVATAFTTLAAAIRIFQGNNLTGLYDSAALESDCASIIAGLIASGTSGLLAANLDETNAWNQVVVLPSMNMLGSVIGNAAFTQQGQQNQVIRNVLLKFAEQIAQFILIISRPQTAQINMTVVRNGESLMDIAARALGNFEQWTAIAALNGLAPPYIGPIAAPGVAAWGSQLILPAPGTQLSSVGDVPSYTVNYLGTDIYAGPINGAFPAWSGDYELITGYPNLSWALGRRIQTTLSTLLFHEEYGSRIPPEVGAVQDRSTVGNIAAYGTSCLLSDPRVVNVLSAAASGVNGLVSFAAVVQPGGFGSLATAINEVITNVPQGAQ